MISTDSFSKLPEEKQNGILHICMDAFIESGYALANTVEIAKKCGIAKGSVFHYFGSKKSLFLHSVRVCMDRVMDETRLALSGIDGKTFFDRARKSAEVKMTLPLKYPRETALLARAFAENGHEATEELFSMAAEYAALMRALTDRTLGDIETELLREGISGADARAFVQTVFDGVGTRLLKQYASQPQALLGNPKILSDELEKTIGFILHGIGKEDAI